MDLTSLPAPVSELLWTAFVDVDDRQDLGASKGGHRFMVPVVGGTFIGGPNHSDLCGNVLPGGADRQFLRPDGVKELCAIYELQTTSGDVLSIENAVIVDESRKPNRYAMSVLRVSAPEGPLAWLNRRLIVGTLKSRRPEVDQVIIQAYLMDTA